jgi:hypothetical protein
VRTLFHDKRFVFQEFRSAQVSDLDELLDRQVSKKLGGDFGTVRTSRARDRPPPANIDYDRAA